MLGFTTNLSASHYRYGNIKWRKINNSTNQVEFTVTQAWRLSAFFGSAPSLGTTTPLVDYLYYGDGSSVGIYLKVTAVNTSEDWFVGEFKVNKTYSSNGTYTAYNSSCCRISTLQGGANDQNFTSKSIVNIGNTNNSPTSTMPPIINLQVGLSAASFTIPGADPDNDNLTWTAATATDVGFAPNSRFAVTSSGAATFNTSSLSVGQLWFGAAVISDGQSNTMVDFIIKIVSQSNPPAFDYTVTPTNGYTYLVPPNTNISFTVKATDSDAGSTVGLSAVGVPSGSTWSPPGTPANPISSTFSWTPGNSDLGTRIVTFTAQDNNSVQTQTSVTIKVSLKPIFSIPPTPATATLIVREPGTNMTFTAQAYDPDNTDVVTINKLEGLNNSSVKVPMSNSLFSGVSFSTPTTTGNPTSGSFSWTPGIASWGVRNLYFTAEDSYGDKTEHEVSVIVNTTPDIQSTAPTSACVGNPFTYNFVATDPDTSYGDVLEVHDINLPAWLSFTDNGDGTATITGTPSSGDIGNHSFSIDVEDMFHHSNIGGIPRQEITLAVSVCEQSCGAGAPTGANVTTGNVTINTQTQMDAFYSTVSGANNGKKWTKISGSLTLNGNSSTDPITDFCNLSKLTEITGTLLITNFNKSGNPTDLSKLASLTTIGCNLTVTSNPQLLDLTLPNLATTGCAVTIKDNSALRVIVLPLLQSIQGDKLLVKNHPKLETLTVSSSASSFNFTGRGSNVEISDNGGTASGNLTMNLKKITTLKGALTFTNNDNAGVSNFDNIFTGLTDISTKWGKLIITNNDYLGTCCIAASVNVGGSGNRHIISGNTGNCADSATVLANCGVFHKKSMSQSGMTRAFVEYNVYPNPSSGIFNLDVMSNQTGQLNFRITDLMGRTILTESHTISQYTSLPISLTSAARGTYFLKAEMNGQVFVKRILLDY